MSKMKYRIGQKYIIKQNMATDRLNEKVFVCTMTGRLDDGCQVVWGELESPIFQFGKIYTNFKLHEDDFICREVATCQTQE